ncbi:4Fe-4S double cluster binding domain-containing protein [candidate division CSSED10-310 bacterium]|uniref:4Fe-4S double cluster binding domain-containing protein n=1 Tax=candidate division CSSED10-310 bacterium TaxID=2855610 RepID=A0ABV6Z0C2_UNCC1
MMNNHQLKKLLLNNGANLVGYASLQVLPAVVRKKLPYGISIVVALNPAIMTKIRSGPTHEYYAEYKRVNTLLNTLSAMAADYLKKQGARAITLSATESDLDLNTLAVPLPHKTVATRAGLGWIGRCALLITRQYGSAVRLTSVLTDAPLAVKEPEEQSFCGECTSCLDICPGHAVSGKIWQVGAARNTFFDAFACHRAATEKANAVNIKTIICGMCIANCPWTLKYTG